MGHTILETFAQTLVRYSLEIRPGDLLVIRSTTLAVPLIREVFREALRAGANPVVRLTFDGQDDMLLKEGSKEQLAWLAPMDLLEAERITARLTIQAPFNTRGGLPSDPEASRIRARAVAGPAALAARRAAAGEMRWCGTLFPTHALAQEAEMSLAEYEEFVYGAMFLDREDPISEWRAFSVEQQKKVDRLDQARDIRIVAEDTDLRMSVQGRKWMNSDGHRNFPSGEVFTGPVEESVNGHIRFTFPAIRGGAAVEDVRLRFENGRLVDASAARGEEVLLREIETDEGARYLGEVAIGNNYGIQRFTRNTLFDEKIGGTCHVALGSSYPDTGGKNQSAVHWDMVCDLRQGGAIYADGELIHENGSWKF